MAARFVELPRRVGLKENRRMSAFARPPRRPSPKPSPKASSVRVPMPKWGWLEWFMVAQTALPALMFIPGLSAVRTPSRIAAFSIALVAWGVICGEGVRTRPGRRVPGDPLAGGGDRLALRDDPPPGRQHDAVQGRPRRALHRDPLARVLGGLGPRRPSPDRSAAQDHVRLQRAGGGRRPGPGLPAGHLQPAGDPASDQGGRRPDRRRLVRRLPPAGGSCGLAA